MTTPKFTPGPWTASHLGPMLRAVKIVSTRALRIAPIAGPAFAYLPEGREDIQSANADLIAAAPDMFAALEEIERVTTCSANCEHDEDDRCPIYLARAALAKARGESP